MRSLLHNFLEPGNWEFPPALIPAIRGSVKALSKSPRCMPP